MRENEGNSGTIGSWHGGQERTERIMSPSEDGCRPFLKWAGGKRQLLSELMRYVPDCFNRYFEPFLGGAALFFQLRPPSAVLADVNARLIRTYLGVRNAVGDVIGLLERYPHEPSFFYSLRQRDVDIGTDAEVAAWFIYLNRTGYNGLYRVNRANRFNVPFGRYENPTICDAPNLHACSAALGTADLRIADFADVTAQARAGDFVYFDPPYAPLSETSSFTSYTSSGFGQREQERLRDVARHLKARGVSILVSNSSAPSVRNLYRHGFEVREISAMRLVNSKASRRGAITELLIR